jgi:hypothetical protein
MVNLNKDTAFDPEISNLASNILRRRSNTGAAPERPLFEYLTGETDFDDFMQDTRTFVLRAFDNRSESIEDSLDVYIGHFNMEKPAIDKDRIKQGFNNGMIDYVKGALLKTQFGWINEEKSLVFAPDAPLINIAKFIRNEVDVLPSVSIRDLERAEQDGVFYINAKKVAEHTERNGQTAWIDLDSQKTFDTGDLIRLIHHRHEPIAIKNSNPSTTYYHSNISDSKQANDAVEIREGTSIQGDAVYATGSVDEAVKIYGNPYSSESTSKRLLMRQSGIDDSVFKNGHLYQVETTATLYEASMKPRRLNMHDIPSLPLILVAAEKYKVNEVFAHNLWLDMKDSSSTFEVYKWVDEFNSLAIQNSGETGAMQDILNAMGYEGIEIVFPENEIQLMNDKLDKLKSIPDSEFSEYKNKKDTIIKSAEVYIDSISSAIPAKGQTSHMIVYNKNLIERTHLTTLPEAKPPRFDKNTNTVKEGLYWSDEPVTLDMLKEKEVKKTVAYESSFGM